MAYGALTPGIHSPTSLPSPATPPSPLTVTPQGISSCMCRHVFNMPTVFLQTDAALE